MAAGAPQPTRHADYGRRWGEGAARCFSIEGDFLDEDQGVRLMPVPESFMCPISLAIMADPVAAVDGSTYDRDYIERWFRQRRQEKKPLTSPVTGLELSSTTLMPLAALQRAIEAYMTHRPELRRVPDLQGRSFAEAAQVLQSDLLEKQSLYDNTEDEVKRLREKNEVLQRALRKAEETCSGLMCDVEHLRERLWLYQSRFGPLSEGATADLGVVGAGAPIAKAAHVDSLQPPRSTGNGASPLARAFLEKPQPTPAHPLGCPPEGLATATGVAAAAAARRAAEDAVMAGALGAAASSREPRRGAAHDSGSSLRKCSAPSLASCRFDLLLPLLVVIFSALAVVQFVQVSRYKSRPEHGTHGIASTALSLVGSSYVAPMPGAFPLNFTRVDTEHGSRRGAARPTTPDGSGDQTILEQVHRLQANNLEDRKQAAFGLWRVAIGNPDNQVAIARAGAVGPLVLLLADEDAEVQEAAAAVLGNLASNNARYRATVAKAGAIRPLIEILKRDKLGARVVAARALWALATASVENQVAMAEAGAVEPLVGMLRDHVARVRVAAAAALCGLAVDHPENQVAIARAGAIPPLVGLLRETAEGARVAAAAALRNLAIANPENQASLVQAGVIKPLVELLRDYTAGAQEDAAFMLANLASNNPNHQTWIARAGAIPPLVELLGSGVPEVQEAASLVLRNLAGDNKRNSMSIVQAGAIAPLAALLSAAAPGVQKQAAWALWNLFAADSVHFAAGVQAGTVTQLIRILGADLPAAQDEIVATLYKLATDEMMASWKDNLSIADI